mgnify:FL=1
MILSTISSAVAVDTVKLSKNLLMDDKRAKYKAEIILKSLQVTEAEFGPFKLIIADKVMTPKRGTISLKNGKIINTYVGPQSKVWDEAVILIPVPVRQGLLSYRLLLIHKSKLSAFSKVKNLSDLSKLKAGLQKDWVVTKVFKENGLGVKTTTNFESLFKMLKSNRLDYMPRGVYEVYDELNMRQSELTDIVVEPTLALHLPMPTYVYVSPNEPRLAERLEKGLLKLIETGIITKILLKYYDEDIKKADIPNRRLISINNPFTPGEDKFNTHRFWTTELN